MQAPNQQQQQVKWGNQAYPVVNPGPSQNSQSNGKLWGSSVRSTLGFIQIICGIIEFAFGVTLICLPLSWYWVYSLFGWGIWNGVFAVITGFIGVYSTRSKCLVITYMVMSIIAAVLSATCCGFTAAVIPSIAYSRQRNSNYNDGSYGYRSYSLAEYAHANAHFAINITLTITFALQMLISILGASFTCGALTSGNNPQQIAYQINAHPRCQPLAIGPAPPYNSLQTEIQSQPYNKDDSIDYSVYTPMNLGQEQQRPGKSANKTAVYASRINQE